MIDDFIRDPNDVLATRLVFKIKDLKTDIKKMDCEDIQKMDCEDIQKMLDDQLNEDATLVMQGGLEVEKRIQTLNKDKVLKKFGFSRRGIIVSVLLATFALVVILVFLIVGMNTFSSDDIFSATLTSSLSVLTGVLVNLRTRKIQFLDKSLIEKKVNEMVKMYIDLSKPYGDITPEDELNLKKIKERISSKTIEE